MENTNMQFDLKKLNISLGSHKSKEVIWIRFNYDKELVKMVKTYTPSTWSNSEKAWYLSDTPQNRTLCGLKKEVVGKQILKKIPKLNQPEFEKFQNILTLKSFSENTIKTYSVEFAQLLYFIGNFPVQNLEKERLQSYFLYCAKEMKLSENQIHSRMNAVKFYYEKVLHRERLFFDIPRPKKPQLLPKSLSSKEIQRLFQVVTNPKHKLILQLCYGMGLRVSEIVQLKLEDIDGQRMKVLVQRGKGKKDRYVNLPYSVLEDLRNYYREYRPKVFLFEGQTGGQFTIRSVQLIFKNAMKKAGIQKTIGIHGLRHSYATHLLELGTDITFIQKLLGHNNIKTTLAYTNVTDNSLSKIISPLDRQNWLNPEYDNK